jgi:hypothetical protein
MGCGISKNTPASVVSVPQKVNCDGDLIRVLVTFARGDNVQPGPNADGERRTMRMLFLRRDVRYITESPDGTLHIDDMELDTSRTRTQAKRPVTLTISDSYWFEDDRDRKSRKVTSYCLDDDLTWLFACEDRDPIIVHASLQPPRRYICRVSE